MEFQHVKITGGDAFERGRQHGEFARANIERGLRHYQDLFEHEQHVSWKAVREKAMAFVEPLEKDYEDLLDEVRGIGAGAGIDFEDMMVLNTRYELLKFPIQECTSFSLLSAATQNGHVYVGMNWDNLEWMRDSTLLMTVDEGNGMRYFCMTEAGQLVRHGFNSFGIGITTNNLESTGDKDQPGVPTNFMRRRVLTSHSLQEAVDSVRRAFRSVSCNLMIASAENDACDMEVNPVRAIEMKPYNGILTHANHFALGMDIERDSGLHFRDERLRSLFAGRSRELEPEGIMACLKDHYKKSDHSHEAICKHTPLEHEDMYGNRANASVTIASQIYDLTDRVAYICYGAPCTGTYREYKL